MDTAVQWQYDPTLTSVTSADDRAYCSSSGGGGGRDGPTSPHSDRASSSGAVGSSYLSVGWPFLRFSADSGGFLDACCWDLGLNGGGEAGSRHKGSDQPQARMHMCLHTT